MGNIGQRIRVTRTKNKISRSALAKAAGIAYSTLSDIELGRTNSTFSLNRLAAALGVNPQWLESGRGRPESNVKAGALAVETATDNESQALFGDRIADAYAAIRWRYMTDGRTYELERDPIPLVLAYRFACDPSEANRVALAAALDERLQTTAKDKTENDLTDDQAHGSGASVGGRAARRA